MAATTAAALTTLRGATTDAATTGPCLEEDDCFPNLYDDYTVEAVAGALAFVVLLAVMVLAVVCDRDAKGVRATAQLAGRGLPRAQARCDLRNVRRAQCACACACVRA